MAGNDKMIFFPGIQVLRAVLFVMVCAFHCGVPMSEIGWGGVETFFIISSFLLVYKQLGREDIKVFDSCKRRIKRLYPPYLVTLFACCGLTVVSGAIPYDIVSHLLASQNFEWMITGYSSPMRAVTAHTWTLSIEVWLGILWIILLKTVSKSKFKTAMRICVLVGIAYRTITILCGCNVYVVSLCPLAHVDAFAMGALLAISLKEERNNCWKFGVITAVGLIGIAAVIIVLSKMNQVGIYEAYVMLKSSENYLGNWFTGNIYLFIQLLSAGVTGLIVLHDQKHIYKDMPLLKATLWLGAQSYVLYLFHWPIRKIVVRFVDSWWMRFSLVCITSILCCLVYMAMQKKLKQLKGKNR